MAVVILVVAMAFLTLWALININARDYVYQDVRRRDSIKPPVNPPAKIRPKDFPRDDQVDADTAWFKEAPKEDLSLLSKDKLVLRAVLIKQPNPRGLALVLHGWSTDRVSMAPHAAILYRQGFDVLAPDQRAHGESEGQYTCFGVKETDDALAWLQLMNERNYQSHIVIGTSMGGAVSLMLASRNRDQKLACAVSDCAYSSFLEIINAQLLMKSPKMPPLLRRMFVSSFSAFCQKDADFKVQQAAPILTIAKNQVPLLMIHGQEDRFVPYWMLDKLYAACQSEKQRLDIPVARHGESIYRDYALYERTLVAFVNAHVPKQA